MTTAPRTVEVNPIVGFRALKMTWQHRVNDKDIEAAFGMIMDALKRADAPLVVVVDLRQNPKFPLRSTISEASAPYRHPMMGEWLIIGSNWAAHAIERTLSNVTRRRNVQWFANDDEVIEYLQQRIAQAS